ncbi:hypothetical protein QMK19_20825 [Streptomyces sp. H10-C2]|uniref:hypothetical protein n=1 Tax=unclassified Streptomyces TaxID=2593676 RepID=UPI0024BBBEBF|nr:MULTISPECIES: hypothetical protein [unclassified Streptomyces]MDJ0344469.1 hypothetical protein [Streptomyces sp. PH10-H1]MDJ0372055.1 hypothetical protein [Streptomyces sp. H10-C2]
MSHPDRRQRPRRVALLLTAALTAAVSCSPAANNPAPSRPPPSTASQPVSQWAPSTPTVSASTPITAPSTTTLDEHAAGTTIQVSTGTTVLVQLHSRYWSLPASSNQQVMAATSGANTPAGTCQPGVGCGVSSADFTARQPGTAQITAHRTICGEAMRCPPGQSTYRVTINVAG